MSGAVLRAVVVDDQRIIRTGLRTMLDAEPDIDVVGEAADGREAIAVAAALQPDVVLMDIRMPELDGVSATRQIMAAHTAGAVLIITTFDDEAYLLESVRAGASGFLLKDAGADLLAAAVRSAARGDSLIDPAMTKRLLEHRLSTQPIDQTEVGDPRAAALISELSAREREVLAGLARGLSNSAIAGELYVSETTVKSHVSSVLLKTGSRSRVHAAVLAYESGFVRPGWLAGTS
jgi:DNA-binding NarL/FixJ family response regulator